MSEKGFLRATVQNDLANLEKSYREMLQQQQQLDNAIQQQAGGIQYARMLLEKIDEQEKAEAATPVEAPVVEGLPEGMEAMEVVEAAPEPVPE